MRDLRWPILACALILLSIGQRSHFKHTILKPKNWFFFYFTVSGVFLWSGISKYFAFEFNGIDFSVFDLNLYNTVHGNFMWSPFCNCNQFAVHASWLFALLVPLHAVFSSPLLLVIIHAISLAASFPILQKLVKNKLPNLNDLEIMSLLLAFMASRFVGSINNYGFHPEVFFIPLGLWFVLSWTTSSRQWILAAILFAAVKEDGALYLLSWAAGCIIVNDHRKSAFKLFAGAVIFFVINVKILQPLHWPEGGFTPSWNVFWAKYGNTPIEVALGAIKKPLEALLDIYHSDFLKFLMVFSFLPLFSLRALFAISPGVVMLGLASSPILKGYGVYYAAPMLPFAVFGFLESLSYIDSKLKAKSKVFLLLITVLVLGSLGGTGLRLGRLKPNVAESLAEWKLNNIVKDGDGVLRLKQKTCVQTALFPHMDYAYQMIPLTEHDACDGQILIDSRLDPYPFEDESKLKGILNFQKGVDLSDP